MKAVVFSGTTEGRNLSQRIAAAGAEVIVSVASDYGAEEQGQFERVTVCEGAKEEAQIRELICGADLVIDATHPYAVIVTENIRRAAEQQGIRRLRLVREQSQPEPDDGIRFAADAAEAARMAGEIAGDHGHVLLTTGSKELGTYAKALDPQRLYPRVLPLVDSIRACEDAGIPHRNIIAIQGPFSEALNRAVIEDDQIDVMITKESGRAGGFLEKIRACRAAGIPAIVIMRPAEDGMSYDAVLETCLTLLHGEK